MPPGAAVVEKLAALFPTATDLFLSVGTRIVGALSSRFAANEEPAPRPVARDKVVRAARKPEPSAKTASN